LVLTSEGGGWPNDEDGMQEVWDHYDGGVCMKQVEIQE